MMVRFKMFKINIVQFAILSKEMAGEYQINTSTEMKHTSDGSAIAVDMTFLFVSNGERHMILQVLCEFNIHPEDVATMTSENEITVPKSVLDYFIAQTVGTARGILHCKTEGTPFNSLIIPPMNVTTLLDSDLIIKLHNK